MLKFIFTSTTILLTTFNTGFAKTCIEDEYLSGTLSTIDEDANCSYLLHDYQSTALTPLCFPDSLLEDAKKFARLKIPAGVSIEVNDADGKTPVKVCHLYWED